VPDFNFTQFDDTFLFTVFVDILLNCYVLDTPKKYMSTQCRTEIRYNLKGK